MKMRRYNLASAVLTPDQVYEIRQEYAAGSTQGELCRKYNVSIGTIGRVVRGETWKQFSGPRAEHVYPQAPPPSQEEIEASFRKLQEQLGSQDPSDERSVEVLGKLEKLAGKDYSIQADKALDELLAPEAAKKFLE